VTSSRPVAVALGPGLPEITVFRPAEDEDALLERALAQGTNALPDQGTPYYADLWPAALPLARWLIAERACRDGARVLELGCGLGLVGLALAKAANVRVTLTDGAREALELVREAVARNAPFAHPPGVAHLDWRVPERGVDELGGRFPVIVGADVLYAPESFGPLARAAATLLRRDGVLYLAEPQRPVARGALAELRETGLQLEEKAPAENGVVVQIWRFPSPNVKTGRCC
jgi:predicted nicotinamide N-methyase